MDKALNLFSAIVCSGIGLAAIGAVLSHRVKDGIVIKAGLIALAFGMLGVAWQLLTGWSVLLVSRALGTVHIGLVVVAVGYWMQHRKGMRIHDIVDTRPGALK